MFPAISKRLFSKIVSVILIAFASLQCKTQQRPDSKPKESTGFALLELFTSQGCSSCPPADNLLGEYAKKDNDHIIALAFHVDYWNRLGWTDSFSSPGYSDRQQYYATMMNSTSVYTPQLIINGSKDIVGSNREGIALAVNNALNEKPVLSIAIDKIEEKDKKIAVNYSVDTIFKGTTLQAALVQKQVTTNILKGENRGVRLINYNVVRSFISLSSYLKQTPIEIELPPGYTENEFAVILFIQRNSSGKILAAAKKDL